MAGRVKHSEVFRPNKPTKPKRGYILKEGVVVDQNRGVYRVELDDIEHIVMCRRSGKMDQRNIDCRPGSRVMIEINMLDLSKGRIIWRE